LRSEGPVADRPGAGVDRHKLDGSDASAFARGTGVTVLANRIVLGDGQVDVLLTHPDLGNLSASCMGAGSPLASIFWTNTGATVMDTWYNTTADARYRGVWSSPNSGRQVARYNASDQLLYGDTLIVGKGTTPGCAVDRDCHTRRVPLRSRRAMLVPGPRNALVGALKQTSQEIVSYCDFHAPAGAPFVCLPPLLPRNSARANPPETQRHLADALDLGVTDSRPPVHSRERRPIATRSVVSKAYIANVPLWRGPGRPTNQPAGVAA
jgi:hypothetical protein